MKWEDWTRALCGGLCFLAMAALVGWLFLAGAGIVHAQVGPSDVTLALDTTRTTQTTDEETYGKGEAMELQVALDGLAMPPFNTTMMGVVKGALDYYGIEATAPSIYSATGHAFLINIHKELCPSGPYCFNRERMAPLIGNLGLKMTDLGYFSRESSPEERAAVEQKLRNALDCGVVCYLLNNENQLITGYDTEGFTTFKPWGDNMDYPPARLTFGNWTELGEEIHINFYTLEQVTPSERRKTVVDSLRYALDVHENPTRHADGDYGAGPNAYANWIGATEGFGDSHGNWWNGTVWSECRRMGADYFAELAHEYPEIETQATELSRIYAQLAEDLAEACDKELGAAEKKKVLTEAQAREARAMPLIAALVEALESAE